MRCLYCGKEIGIWRAWRDREFCSRAHRNVGRVSSARAVRDSETYASSDWEIHHSLVLSAANEERKKAAPSLNPIVVIPLVLFALLALQFLPESAAPLKTTDYVPPGSGSSLWNSLRGAFQGDSGANLRSDFHGGIRDWVGSGAKAAGGSTASSSNSAADWNVASGVLRPGKLRLWKPSLSLADYRFDFQGQIENRALGWAFRASNTQNYYASKLALIGPGNSPAGEIIRYAVLNGKESSRSEFPLPILISRTTSYKIRVEVKGDFFVTSIDGRVVDTWRDARLRSGGVGFFADKGESGLVRWVSVTSTESSFFSRLFAAALLVSPAGMDEELGR